MQYADFRESDKDFRRDNFRLEHGGIRCWSGNIEMFVPFLSVS